MPVAALQRVYDERLAPLRAPSGCSGFKALGAKTLLVSGGFTFFTDKLATRLGFDETVSNALEVVSGRLTGRICRRSSTRKRRPRTCGDAQALRD
jgi:phosphoserine phosphatase